MIEIDPKDELPPLPKFIPACWAWKICTVMDSRQECLHATEAMKPGRKIAFGDFSNQVKQSASTMGVESECVNYTRNRDRVKLTLR